MIVDKQLIYLVSIYFVATVFTFALDWQLPGFTQVAEFSKHIDLDRYLIPDYMTYWQLTHFLTRVVLGYFCPKYWQAIFVIDFGWESLEWFKWGAHNWYDLIWNMLGLITGMMIRHYKIFDKYFNKNGKTSEESPTDGTLSGEHKSPSAQQTSPENTEPVLTTTNDTVAVPTTVPTTVPGVIGTDTIMQSPHMSIKSGDDNLINVRRSQHKQSSRDNTTENDSHGIVDNDIYNMYIPKNDTIGVENGDGGYFDSTHKRKKDKHKKHKTKRN